MLDALTEISRVSLLLQNRETTLVTAHIVIQQTVKHLEPMVDQPGKYLAKVNQAIEAGSFKGIELNSNYRVVRINPAQFFRSLANFEFAYDDCSVA